MSVISITEIFEILIVIIISNVKFKLKKKKICDKPKIET